MSETTAGQELADRLTCSRLLLGLFDGLLLKVHSGDVFLEMNKKTGRM
jgi:hypothetical protein